jgi:molybdopterin-guanine dinucleotide biosynthesis protein A
LSKLFTHIAISTKTAEKFDFEAPFILDSMDTDFAPTSGFVSAFQNFDADRIIVLSVDTPFVDEIVFHALIDADNTEIDAVIAKTASGTHPMCGLYHRSLLVEFERMQREGDHRLGKLLSMSKTCFVDFDDEGPFMNLNHPHEYEAALSRYNNKNNFR